MRFDRSGPTLRGAVAELADLIDGACDDTRDDTRDDTLDDDRRTVASIVDLARRPLRVALIERFGTGPLPPVHVGWRDDGLALIAETDGDQFALTVSGLGDVPAIIAAVLGIAPGCDTGDRRSIETTRAAIAEARAHRSCGREPTSTLDHLMRLAVRVWRVTAGWAGAAADRTLTVIDAGPAGLWSFVEAAGGEDTDVSVRPETADRVMAVLGDVVTGRSIAPVATR